MTVSNPTGGIVERLREEADFVSGDLPTRPLREKLSAVDCRHLDRVSALLTEAASRIEEVEKERAAMLDVPPITPSAYLKHWWNGRPCCRVDLSADNEVWLEALQPTVTPLYDRSSLDAHFIALAAEAALPDPSEKENGSSATDVATSGKPLTEAQHSAGWPRAFVSHFYSRLRLSEKRALFEKYNLPLGDPRAPDAERWKAGLLMARDRGLIAALAQDMGLISPAENSAHSPSEASAATSVADEPILPLPDPSGGWREDQEASVAAPDMTCRAASAETEGL